MRGGSWSARSSRTRRAGRWRCSSRSPAVDSVDLGRRLDRLVPEVQVRGALPGPPPGQRRPGPGQGRLRARRPGGGPARAAGAAAPRGPRPHDGGPPDRPTRARPAGPSAACARLAERCRARWPELGPDLSMGMTDDFELAIEEGATIVRVGRALFGERPHTRTTTTPARHRPSGGVKCMTGRLRSVIPHTRPDHATLRIGPPSETLSFPTVRFAVRLTPRSAVERVEERGRWCAEGPGHGAGCRGHRQCLADPSPRPMSWGSPDGTCRSSPARPAARSWSSSMASSRTPSLPGGRA